MSDYNIKKFILEKNLERFDDNIEKTDNKANFLLAFASALLVGLFLQSNDMLDKVPNGYYNVILKILIPSTVVVLIISTLFSLLVILPRISRDKDNEKKYTSLFYFQDVKAYSGAEENYYVRMNQANEEEIIKDLSYQVVILADICSTKMKWSRFSSISLILGGISTLIVFGILILSQMQLMP